jgi:2-hydroxychromene-2-carboxylate isomerase
MSISIDYYVTSVSPWAYLGHETACAIAARHNAKLVVKPVNLGEMFKISGQVALGERPEVRKRYRLIELQRFAELRGKPLTLHPKYFPTNPALADHTIIAVILSGGDPLDYVGRVLKAVWADELQIAEAETLAPLLEACGFDKDAILAKANTQEVADIRAANTRDAIAVDGTGVPAFVLNGEPFWGQDRLDLLERALASGRAPFKAA